jgi:hypothetical protein
MGDCGFDAEAPVAVGEYLQPVYRNCAVIVLLSSLVGRAWSGRRRLWVADGTR